jgi:hypothetical protein
MSPLETEIREAVKRDGLCELVVRVSRYADLSAAINEPAAWQAVAKYQGRERGPWGVGIRANANAAIRAALEAGRRGGTTGAYEGAPGGDVFG